MKTKILSIIGVTLFTLQTIVCAGCSAKTTSTDAGSLTAEPAQSVPALNAESKQSSWKFKDEQEWIVDTIGKDIAEMLVYAKYRADASVKLVPDQLEFKTKTVDKKLNKYSFEVRLPNSDKPLIYEFTLDRYVWSPATYAPFAKKLITDLKLDADKASPTPDNFLKTLSNAEMPQLRGESDRITAAFAEAPLDPSLHEQAALLQATIDMLEFANTFSDTRAPLCRMASHLAIAQSLVSNGELDIVGQIADVALESMSCRDGVSVTKNDLLAKSQSDPTIKSWLRALKIRSSGDYRLFDEKNQTPLEASQFGLRYAFFLSSDKLLEYVEKHKCTPPLRWMRLVMSGDGSVASGHTINSKIFPAELKDFSEDYKTFNNEALKSQKQMVDELNRPSTRCLQLVNGAPKLVPLSWGDVAAFHARHVLAAVNCEYNFYQNMYGVKEAAIATLKRAEGVLSGFIHLPLIYSNVAVADENKDNIAKLFSGTKKLVLEKPELLSSFAWLQARKLAEQDKHPEAIGLQPEQWFSPAIPQGTAYYFVIRKDLKNLQPDLTELTRLRTLCPLDEIICAEWIKKKYGEHPTSAQLREGYGSLADYDLYIMRIIANGDYDNPEQYKSQMEKIAKISPNNYIELGDYCVLRNDTAAAVKYYELAESMAEDDVLIANNTQWLIDYYFDHGEKQKAFDLAQRAGEVYSAAGLHSLAHVYERMGNFDKAEETYLASKERYDQDGALMGFYIRNKDRNKKYGEMAQQAIKKDFPSGLQKANATTFKGAPTAGIYIKYAMPFPASLGLKKGDIVVALGDYKTDNRNQYSMVQNVLVDRNVKCTYWDGKKYNDLMVMTVRGNMLGLDIETYSPK